MKKALTCLALLLLLPRMAWAAVGCTLSNPAQDLKYLFPEMTSFKEELRELHKMKDGEKLYKGLQDRLGSDLDPVFETIDTPYSVYRVFKGEELIGIVHGVNVPGSGGVIQVFLSTDTQTGEIRKFFYQRLESPAAKALKHKDFRARFEGLVLADFYKHDYYAAADPKSDKDGVAKIENPVADGKGRADFEASIRGIRKNLILLDIFVYEQMNEPYYARAQEAIRKAASEKKPEEGGVKEEEKPKEDTKDRLEGQKPGGGK